MPKLQLPKFNGQYKDSTPFHEQFVASFYASSTIADVQKFIYLEVSLSGEALQLVSRLPSLSSNYHISMKSLIDRYINQRLIVNSHLD